LRVAQADEYPISASIFEQGFFLFLFLCLLQPLCSLYLSKPWKILIPSATYFSAVIATTTAILQGFEFASVVAYSLASVA